MLKGEFRLAPGLCLIYREKTGFVLQPYPLKAVRVNRAALRILEQCRKGICLQDMPSSGDPEARSLAPFLDALYRMGLVEWTPGPGSFEPFVSIIVPVYNRAAEIGECIESLLKLNYPKSRLEIIVIDDASSDGTADVVRGYDVELIVQSRNLGQSAARNSAVRASRGEIVAFIDSDCVADPDWLRELVPYFLQPGTALVGGFVASHFKRSKLDRYEDARSALNMGNKKVICNTYESDFYVPTCNMLVRKDAYLSVGGLDEAWRVGEDVDLCWKLKKQGSHLLYVPKGKVRHKHRNLFFKSFKRRFDYGTSEPALYERHKEVQKRFPIHIGPLCFILFCSLGLLTRSAWFLLPAIATTLSEAFIKKLEIRRKTGIELGFPAVFKASARTCSTLAYYLTLHLTRYHLFLIALLTYLFPSIAPLTAAILLLPPTVEFIRKKPRLSWPLFIFFFFSEQAFYQAGVFWASIRHASFRCYRFRFERKKSPGAALST